MNKTVLITGASTGLGNATARYFHAQGWNVVATMRAPAGSDLAGERMLVTALDVEDHGTIAAAVDAAVTRFGRIDALVNNAGYGAYGPLEATPFAKIRRQFDVNVLGLLATTQAVLPHLRANRAGTIVNVSSIGGRVALPLGTLYHGSKFAVEGLSEALQYELLPLGIRVKIVEPGGIKTDFAGRSFDFNNDRSLAEYQPTVGAVMDAFGPFMAGASSAEHIAGVVYAATTDTSDQLRFEAGADAKQLLAGRRAADDASFFAGIRAQFGLPGYPG